ncbi:hypothetical protein V6B05_01555 [Lactococcus garvieae]|uniref:hypothetical protein n=1 Tax=Lactococcus garvieae TaxID=1363 RepID=UPI001F600A78|nr:hypothetical protein [Lactococcus garvieae]MCI3860113.1 hypothetical protein [Lactococcus garvieae]
MEHFKNFLSKLTVFWKKSSKWKKALIVVLAIFIASSVSSAIHGNALKDIPTDYIKAPDTAFKSKDMVEEELKQLGLAPKFVVSNFDETADSLNKKISKNMCEAIQDQANVEYFSYNEYKESGDYIKKGSTVIIGYSDHDYDPKVKADKEKAEEDKKQAVEKAAKEKAVAEQEAKDKKAKTEQEAKEKAEAEKKAKEKADKDAKDKLEKEKAEADKKAKEKADKENSEKISSDELKEALEMQTDAVNSNGTTLVTNIKPASGSDSYLDGVAITVPQSMKYESSTTKQKYLDKIGPGYYSYYNAYDVSSKIIQFYYEDGTMMGENRSIMSPNEFKLKDK